MPAGIPVNGLAMATNSVRKTSPPISASSISGVRGFEAAPEPKEEASNPTGPNSAGAPMPKDMEHIDRKEIYTSLEARVAYLHSFLDFTYDDVQTLTAGSKYLKSLIPAIVNIVYKKLLKYDITARAFTTRSTSYEGPVDEFPSESSPQIKYRKMFLRGYLQKLCSDPSKFEFWEYFDKVGMMHVGMGRRHPLHVEYVHIGACLGFIQDVMFEAILSHPRLRLEMKIAMVKSLTKVLWIQNDLFAKWYVRDGEEFDQEEPEFEQEGYLHGKRVNDAKDSEESESEPMGTCPFASMTAGMGKLGLDEYTTGDLPASHIPLPAKRV